MISEIQENLHKEKENKMNTNQKISANLEDAKINVKVTLSALWAALMFIYTYVDIFAFYKPATIENILAGKVWELEITQVWALTALILMTVPSVMIFLPLLLKPTVNRWANIIVAIFYIAVSIGNSIGESWLFILFGSAVEIVLLSLIVWHAWKWPKQEA